MKKLILLLVVAVGLAAGWLYASPMWTLRAMRDAAIAKDSKALAGYVDFEALRSDVKAKAKAKLDLESKKDSGGLGPLGSLLGSAMIEPMVNAVVSPAGIAALMAGEAKLGSGGTASTPKDPGDNIEIERSGLSTFRVHKKNEGKGGGMVFTRSGFGWKLTGMDLPAG
jgi:Protein of unknown function (DUF2939)